MFGLHLLLRNIVGCTTKNTDRSGCILSSSSVISVVIVFLLYAFGNNRGTAT
jgi:hypothetical protein